MAGLQKKTIYRSIRFLSNGDRLRDALKKKATKEVMKKVVRETAGWTQPDLTLRR